MLCVCDRRLPDACVSELLRLGIEPVLLPPLPALPSPVASHTDLLVLLLGKTVLTHASYAEIGADALERIAECGYEIKLCDTAVGEVYPRDVALCACATHTHLICNRRHTAPDALALACTQGLTVIDVAQGYAKCSCAVLADGAMISADIGVCRAFRAHGGEALLVSAGNVLLPPYEYGFIGGASGLCADTLFFAGNIKSHPDAERILDFCARHRTRVRSLSSDALFDVGSMIFI